MGVNVSDIALASDGGVVVINEDTRETWRKANEDAAWARSGGKAFQVSNQTSGGRITVGPDNDVYRLEAH